jgi:hypothetical protein
VDTPRVKGGQGTELLGHHQGRVVGQHDAAGADPDTGSLAGDMAHQHGGGGAGDAVQVVVFRQPEALEAEALPMAGQGDRVGDGVGGVETATDMHQVQDGQFDLG